MIAFSLVSPKDSSATRASVVIPCGLALALASDRLPFMRFSIAVFICFYMFLQAGIGLLCLETIRVPGEFQELFFNWHDSPIEKTLLGH